VGEPGEGGVGGLIPCPRGPEKAFFIPFLGGGGSVELGRVKKPPFFLVGLVARSILMLGKGRKRGIKEKELKEQGLKE